MTREEVRQIVLDKTAQMIGLGMTEDALRCAQTYAMLAAPEDYVMPQYPVMEQAEMQRLSED